MELEQHWDTDSEPEGKEVNALLLAGGDTRLDYAATATAAVQSATIAAAAAEATLRSDAAYSNEPQQPTSGLTNLETRDGSFAATASAAAASTLSPSLSPGRSTGSIGGEDAIADSGGGGGGDAGGGVAAEARATNEIAGHGATASGAPPDAERAGMAMVMENFGGRSTSGGASSGVVDSIRPRFRRGFSGGGGDGDGGGSILGGVLLGDQGRTATAAAAASAASSRIEREAGWRSRSSRRSRGDPTGRRGVRRRGGDREEGRIEEGNEEEGAGVSFARFDYRDGQGTGSSSTGSSDSEEPSSPGAAAGPTATATVVEVSPPEEIMRALATSHNTIALLLLLLLHYVVTRILSIAVFVVGTAIIVGLDQRFHAHSDAEVLQSRFILVGVGTTAVLVVGLSAMCFNEFSAGEGLLRGLLLMSPKPDLATVSAVIRTTVVVDLWARLLSVAVKAVLAVACVSGRGSGSTNSGTRGSTNSSCTGLLCPRVRYHCLRRFPGYMRRRRGDDTRTEGGAWRGNSPTASRSGESSGNGADHGSSDGSGGVGDGSGGGGGGRGTRLPVGARRVWRAWLCCSERLCVGPYRWSGRDGYGRVAASDLESIDGRYPGSASAGVGDGDASGERGEVTGGGEGRGGGARGAAGLLSRASRQRRVSAVVEMGFMVYRCILPVPVWLGFYSKDSDYFAAVYLVLKGMEVSFRTDRLVRAVCYVRRGELDRGKFATTEEVVEAGSPDCSICYDQMDRPLLLPCDHLFCGECVAEWLERERTCPLCRAEVPTSNPIPKPLRDGRTPIVPQMF